MELLLIRHTRPEADPELCIGQLDVDCAAGWEPHADRLGKIVPKPDRLYTSPARRCRLLADRLAPGWQLAPRADARLLELDFGDWEGRPWSSIGHDLKGRADGSHALAPPHGETWGALLVRVGAFLDGLGTHAGRVAIVTHAGPVRAALVHCLGLPAVAGSRFEIGYGRLSRLSSVDGEWRLEVLNA
jgi:alpha-ribazole phosphatase